MQRIFRTLLFWTLILGACSPIIPSPKTVPPSDFTITPPPQPGIDPTTEVPFDFPTAIQVPKIILTVATPHIDLPPNGELPNPKNPTPNIPPPVGNCGYQWAYKDLPELSADFQKSIQALQPEAQASAFAFGEDCIYADGTSTFLAMETDFNITVQANDLSNEAELGEWIVKVMQVVENIPKESIVGPRPGRVSIRFQAGNDQKFVNFYIDQYLALRPGLSNAEIYQALQTPQ